MATEYHFKKHLAVARKHRFHLGFALIALIAAAVSIATSAPPTHAATTYDSQAIILVTGDYQGSTSATSIQHSFGTCTSSIGQLFTIQAGFYTTCDGWSFGSPDGLYLYIPTAPAGFYVANWRVTGNSTNGSVSCSTTQCYLNYTSGTANFEVDINATTRPTAPVISVGGTTASSVAFNWTAGSAGSATFYNYLEYYNGSANGSTSARSYNWTGLSCGQTVSMKVAIRTSAGNYSSNTASGSATACAPPPAPTPPPPSPAPAPTPVPVTPRPVTKTTPSSSSKATAAPVATGSAPNLITSSSAIPATPGNFQAAAASNNALVTLSWDAATDVNAIQSYKLERSLDQTTWTVVGGDIVNSSFTDDTVAFGVHYYYRLSAISVAGAVSGYALRDVSVGRFVANSVSSDVGNYYSADKIARVEIPVGAINNDSAVCTVEVSTVTLGTATRPVVAGPYSLVCKTVGGDLITDFTKPVSWTYNLKTKLKGFDKPSAVSLDSYNTQSDVTNAVYDAKAQTLQFNQSSASTTAVVASKSQGLSGNLIAVVLVLVLAVGGGFALVMFKLRNQNHQDYDKYLRKKYYDL